MIIYLSGPMSGYPDHNFPAFVAAAARLREIGHHVISPHEVVQPVLTWEACMRNDIKVLMDADVVAVLPGWKASKGARLEITIASALGMQIVDVDRLEPVHVDVSVDIQSEEQVTA